MTVLSPDTLALSLGSRVPSRSRAALLLIRASKVGSHVKVSKRVLRLLTTATAAAAAKEGVHGALFLRGFEFGAHFGVHCAVLLACFYLIDKRKENRREEKRKQE